MIVYSNPNRYFPKSWRDDQSFALKENAMSLRRSLMTLFVCAASVFAQQHRVGTSGSEPSPLQGQGRWHYRASLPHARSEVAVAEVTGKVYVIGGYADGFVDQPLNEEY